MFFARRNNGFELRKMDFTGDSATWQRKSIEMARDDGKIR
jgi:hypothetical protein